MLIAKQSVSLRAHKKKLTSTEDVKYITGIGEKIREKIREIISTGSLKKAKLLEV